MPDERLPKQVLKYKPTGCQDHGKRGMGEFGTDFFDLRPFDPLGT
jgi:hypothetical protein